MPNMEDLGITMEPPKEKFKFLNVLFHGFSGIGKTSAVATACLDERTAPVLVCDFEGGAPLRFMRMPKGSYAIKRISQIRELNAVYSFLAEGNSGFKSVVLDSLTEAQKIGMQEMLYSGGGASSFANGVVSIKAPELKQWGQSATQMATLVRFFRDLPLHCFFTTLTQVTKDENTGRITYDIALPGKQSTEIPAIPDIVGYIETSRNTSAKHEERVIRFQPERQILAKDRTDALEPVTPFPKDCKMIPEMLDKIYSAYGIA